MGTSCCHCEAHTLSLTQQTTYKTKLHLSPTVGQTEQCGYHAQRTSVWRRLWKTLINTPPAQLALPEIQQATFRLQAWLWLCSRSPVAAPAAWPLPFQCLHGHYHGRAERAVELWVLLMWWKGTGSRCVLCRLFHCSLQILYTVTFLFVCSCVRPSVHTSVCLSVYISLCYQSL